MGFRVKFGVQGVGLVFILADGRQLARETRERERARERERERERGRDTEKQKGEGEGQGEVETVSRGER